MKTWKLFALQVDKLTSKGNFTGIRNNIKNCICVLMAKNSYILYLIITIILLWVKFLIMNYFKVSMTLYKSSSSRKKKEGLELPSIVPNYNSTLCCFDIIAIFKDSDVEVNEQHLISLPCHKVSHIFCILTMGSKSEADFFF